MQNIITINNTQVVFEQAEGGVFTDSKTIAEVFGKRHDNVMSKIREKEHLFGRLNFKESSYINEQNKEQPMYLLDRDFFSFIVMGFTGTEADQWKLAYIKAFNMMEKRLLNPIKEIEVENNNTLDNQLKVFKVATEILRVNETSKIKMLSTVCKNNNIPTNFLLY
jgi:Rha family phage regulatory protein